MNTNETKRKKHTDNVKYTTAKSNYKTENSAKRDYRLNQHEKRLYVKETGFKYKRAAK